MVTHSSVFAWRIPGTGEPGGLLPIELHRIGHDWSDLARIAKRKIFYFEIQTFLLWHKTWIQLLNTVINFIIALALYLFDGSRNVEESMKKMILITFH